MFRPVSLAVLLLLPALVAGGYHITRGNPTADDADFVKTAENKACENRTQTVTHSEALTKLVRDIQSEQVEAQYHVGDVLLDKAENELEEVGACLMDKVDSIVNEGATWEDIHGLRVDLASCCTKASSHTCMSDIAEAHDILLDIETTKAEMNRKSAHAAALILRAAEKRVPRHHFSPRMQTLIGRCKAAPEKCTMDMLMLQVGVAKEHQKSEPAAEEDEEEEEDEDDEDKQDAKTKEKLGKEVEHIKKMVKKIADKADNEDEEATVTRAQATLADMVQSIDKGKDSDTFFSGDVFTVVPKNKTELVGGCLLDKVSSIVIEEAYLDDLQLLLKDLGACCSKQRSKGCVEDVERSYELLSQGEGEEDEDKRDKDAAVAAALLIKAAEKRVQKSHLKPQGHFFLGKCKDPEDCTMQELIVHKAGAASLLEVETTTLVLR